ncbi:uncharacterized protein [Choristoneura fumiferana]|uniref:uncharacterized protein n=1 Tax=Choristoneura fumiferana TaxID=7141 RepID=UPI003D159EDC
MDLVKRTFEKWDPKLSEVELHFRLLLLAVGMVIISVCCCCCYCYNEWGNSETSSIDDAGVHEIREFEVLPPSDDEAAGASRNLLSGLKVSTSDGNEDISIQSDSGESTSEIVVVIKSNTEDHSGGTFTIENDTCLNSSNKNDKDDTSHTTNDSDTKTKSEDTVDKENTLNDRSKQCCSQEDDCGKAGVEGNSSKTEAASVTNVDSEDLEAKNTTLCR